MIFSNQETLRIYPVMGWLDHVATKDYQIDKHLTIPAGTPVYINAAGMQLDPQYFPDPMVFDPDWFLPENVDVPAFRGGTKDVHWFVFMNPLYL
ncbi:unnamed protein product [Arctia plantaginis]|uniref:unspecific monooxygenase n=1 Tax=Arctia plantaginis TaxID=874455 RepID=A0A8S1AYZ3_ARCPL|nr:unnamed protein product [Arctia plantaginis]